MSNPTHVAIVRGGKTAIDDWRQQMPIRSDPQIIEALMNEADSKENSRDRAVVFDEWRIDHPDGYLDVSGEDFSRDSSLVGADLSLANLSRCKLPREMFESTLLGANAQGADFEGIDFTNADLRYTQLVDANIGEAYFDDADLKRTWFMSAIGSGAHFKHSRSWGADFSHSKLNDCNFWNADFHHANLEYAVLERGFFQDATLYGANFSNAVLVEAELLRANLIKASLLHTDLRDANLEKANLYETHLVGTTITGASFKKARFTKTEIVNVNFSDVDIQGATFEGAVLNEASFAGAINLPLARKLQVSVAKPEAPRGIDEAALKWRDRYLRWDQLKALGRLPLFAISSVVLVSIPLMIFILATYNDQVTQVRAAGQGILDSMPEETPPPPLEEMQFRLVEAAATAIESHLQDVESTEDADLPKNVVIMRSVANAITKTLNENEATKTADSVYASIYKSLRAFGQRLSNTPFVVIPDQMLPLLIGTLLLLAGSIIYTIWCPSQVKEFSEDQWVYQLGRPRIHYLAWSWDGTKGHWLRPLFALFYSTGGALTGYVFVTKIVRAFSYIIEHSHIVR